VLSGGAALGISIYSHSQVTLNPSPDCRTYSARTKLTDHPARILGKFHPYQYLSSWLDVPFLVSGILLIVGYGWKNLCRERSFDMLILLGTFVLPQLAAFPVTALGWNPLDYHSPGLVGTCQRCGQRRLCGQPPYFLCCVLFQLRLGCYGIKALDCLCGLVLGYLHPPVHEHLLQLAGFFAGSVGALGYWLQQQGVHRGGQPWYYYLLIQIPVYEFLPALGVGLAAYFGLRRTSPAPLPAANSTPPNEEISVSPELLGMQKQSRSKIF